MSDDLDQKLAEYLSDRAEEKSAGITLQKVYDAQVRLANHFDRHVALDEKRFDEVANERASMDRRLVHVEADLSNLKTDAETTGEHAIDALTAAAEAKGKAEGLARSRHPMRRVDDHLSWWRKAVESGAGKAAALLVALVLGWLLQHVGLK